ncbi:hypothetical protein OHV05_20235 [Kitasatospora sp. NBC_00070]|uniref:hypothetical protein n=1 Tax=Kitasatospora sp. NBC_00070 TaxID=2975962 RepID=UPI00324A2E29
MPEQQPEQREPEQPGQDAGPKPKLVFDDPFDRQTSDDTDQGWGGAGESTGRGIDWYRSQRPPHHGG